MPRAAVYGTALLVISDAHGKESQGIRNAPCSLKSSVSGDALHVDCMDLSYRTHPAFYRYRVLFVVRSSPDTQHPSIAATVHAKKGTSNRRVFSRVAGICSAMPTDFETKWLDVQVP